VDALDQVATLAFGVRDRREEIYVMPVDLVRCTSPSMISKSGSGYFRRDARGRGERAAGSGATEAPSVSTSVIEPSSTQKSTLVMIASVKNTALLSLANLISSVLGAPRTEGTTLRATFSSAARTRTTATRFILTAKLFMTATPHYQRRSTPLRPPRQRQ
jgi:hypothetical protein